MRVGDRYVDHIGLVAGQSDSQQSGDAIEGCSASCLPQRDPKLGPRGHLADCHRDRPPAEQHPAAGVDLVAHMVTGDAQGAKLVAADDAILVPCYRARTSGTFETALPPRHVDAHAPTVPGPQS